MTEVLQDEMRMSEAQNNYIQAHYNYQVTNLTLLKLTGKSIRYFRANKSILKYNSIIMETTNNNTSSNNHQEKAGKLKKHATGNLLPVR